MGVLGSNLDDDINVGNVRGIKDELERIRLVINKSGIVAADTSQRLGIAPFAMELVSVKVNFGVTSTSGTMMIGKGVDTEAIGGGSEVNCLSGTIDLSGTADNQVAGSLHATQANYQFAAGNTIVMTLGGTLTGLADCCVTLEFKQI